MNNRIGEENGMEKGGGDSSSGVDIWGVRLKPPNQNKKEIALWTVHHNLWLKNFISPPLPPHFLT